MFKRVYSSVLEELLRKHLFTINSMKIFIHNFLFYIGRRSYFLSLNKYADRRRNELHKLYSMKEGADDDDVSLASDEHQRFKRSSSRIQVHDESNPDGFRINKNSDQTNTDSHDQTECTDRHDDRIAVRVNVDDLKLNFVDEHNFVDESIRQIDLNGLLERLPTLNDTTFIDWRDSGCMTFVRDQLDCGSCYAFATVSLMEWSYCQTAANKFLGFSEQYMVDCGQYTNLFGCEGANIDGMKQFLKEFGMELRSNYPYKGQLGKCPHIYNHQRQSEWNSSEVGHLRPSKESFKYEVITDRNRSIWLELLSKRPLLIIIKCPIDFVFYGGMIHDGHNCNQIDLHAMLLIGDGVENGEEYWLLRNSHGYYWGESGHFRLSKKAPDHCFGDIVNVEATF